MKKTLIAICAALLTVGGYVAFGAAIDNAAPGYKATGSAYNDVGSVVIGMTTDAVNATPINSAHPLPVYVRVPTASDILSASATVTATTGTTALITIAAGRTWVGEVCISVSGSKAATANGNGEVLGTALTVGTNVTPAAGTYFEVDTAIGANAATGTVGTNGSAANCTKWTQVSPAGNTTTLNYVTTCTSTTACRISISANGVMQ